MQEEQSNTRVLVFAPGLIPSVVIGVLKPLVELTRRDAIKLRVRTLPLRLFESSDIQWCDVAVFCRNTELEDLYPLYQLKRLGKPVIYEIDDNFSEISLNTAIGKYHRAVFRLHAVKRFFALADSVRVYSPEMQKWAGKYQASLSIERSYFDMNLIKGKPQKKHHSKLRISYPTSRKDDPELERFIFAVLRAILIKYPQRIEIHLWRSDSPKSCEDLEGFSIHPLVPTYETFIHEFYTMGIDIGLAPLIDSPFYHSKTNNKYRELGGCGIAGVYSDLPPYNQDVRHHETGLLVENTVDAWVNAISQLIENDSLRQSLQKNAQHDIQHNFSFEQAIQSLHKGLNKALRAAIKPCDWISKKQSLNVVSCFFSKKSSALRQLKETVTLLQGTLLSCTNSAELEKNRTTFSNDSIFIFSIHTLAHWILAKPFLLLGNPIILDLSRYEQDFTELTAQLTGTPSIILNDQQLLMQADLPYTYTVVKSNASDEDHYYSLQGYPAALLELLEKNSIYSSVRNRKQLTIQLSLRRFAALFHLLKNINKASLSRLWVFLQWRFGRYVC